jgi:peptidyl-prolyl cis-trans isomerase C
MKPKPIGILLSVCAGLILLGCPQKEEAKVPPAPQAAQAEVTDSVEKASVTDESKEKEDPMAVSVNEKVVTVADVDRATNILLAQYRDQIPPDQVAQARNGLRKQAVENLINQKLLLGEAERRGIRPEQQEVDARFVEVSGRFSSPEEFRDALHSTGLSKEGLQEEIRQDLKIEALLDKDLKDVKMASGEDVSAFYRDHPESFRSPEQVRASHILIRVDGSASAEDRSQKRVQLAGLRDQIEKGADFGQMASQYSDCPSKARGGDLGYFGRGKMVKPFEDAAFGMKTGEVSEIVETQFGYHLIKVTDHQDPKTAPLEEVRGQIENFLNGQTRDKAIGEYLGKLRGSAKITYAEGFQP